MNNAELIKITDEITIDKKTAPEFLLLYQKSILLALKEQGIIDDMELKACMDALLTYKNKTAG